jgi:hypothetical protein
VLKLISDALLGRIARPTPSDAYDPDAIRRIVSSRSHGNVRLQRGLFYTQKEVDEKFARLRSINFLD